jgi:hypothetical protein
MKELTTQEAYAAMFAFLEYHFRINDSDVLANLLGGMSLLPDGGTTDPAMWHEWLAAVQAVKAGEVQIDLQLK